MPRASQRKQITKRGQSSISRSNRSRSTRNEPDTRASPDKPQTSFLDFPVELRVQTYSYFLTDSLIHLRRTPDDDDSHQTQFIWRACRTPDPRSPLLCAYPTWSTICGPKDRCGDKTQNPTTFPILLTCKTIYKEIKPMIFSHVAISLDGYLDAFVENTTTSVLNTLRRVTLSGYHSLPCRKAPPITTEDGRLLYPGMGLAFHCLLQRLPHLEEIAFQGKIHEQLISTYDSSSKQHALMHKRYFRDLEIFKNCFLLCGPQVTVVFDAETMMGYGSGQEKVGKFTLIRKGKGEEEAMERNGWADRDVVVWREMGIVLTAARREIWGSKMKCDLYG